MDVTEVLCLLDEDDSGSVRSYSSECLDLLGSNESPDEEDSPSNMVFPI